MFKSHLSALYSLYSPHSHTKQYNFLAVEDHTGSIYSVKNYCFLQTVEWGLFLMELVPANCEMIW